MFRWKFPGGLLEASWPFWGPLGAVWGSLGGLVAPRASLETILNSFGSILVPTRDSLGVSLQFLNVISKDILNIEDSFFEYSLVIATENFEYE